MDWMGAATVSQVEVSQHDIYTVVLAQDAAHMPTALERVEPRKRPALNHVGAPQGQSGVRSSK